MNENLEKALLGLISEISNHFGNQAILKGGMSLRLLGIPRSTVDADFVFQPYESRKDFRKPLLNFLEKICDEKPTSQMDSRRFQIRCRYQGIDLLVEPSAGTDIEFESISTGDTALRLGIEPCIISIVSGPVAFANKLGSWLERRLTRDLYDIYIYRDILKVQPHLQILTNRIKQPHYTKKTNPKPKLNSIDEFLDFLQSNVDQISSQQIEDDLEGIIDKAYLPGIGNKIKVAIRMMIF